MEIRAGGKPEDAETAWRRFQAHLNWINVTHPTTEVVQRRMSQDLFAHYFNSYPSVIAVEDDITVGFLITEIREIGILEIINFYVDDMSRDQGVGGEMLQCLEEQCHSRGVHTVIAFASDRYYPGKQLPDGVFLRHGYDTSALTSTTRMYRLAVSLSEEEAGYIDQIRRPGVRTVDDLDYTYEAYSRSLIIDTRDEEEIVLEG